MDDIINTVGSQSTDSDAIIVHSDTIIDDTDDTEGSKSATGSFSADAIQACNNLRAVIVELTRVINQQKVRITSIEHQLTNIVSTLQNISDVQPGFHLGGLGGGNPPPIQQFSPRKEPRFSPGK